MQSLLFEHTASQASALKKVLKTFACTFNVRFVLGKLRNLIAVGLQDSLKIELIFFILYLFQSGCIYKKLYSNFMVILSGFENLL